MQVLQVDPKTFPSVVYSDSAINGKDGYTPIALSDFEGEEQEKFKEILSVFGNLDEMDLSDVATIRISKGAVQGLYAGTIWTVNDHPCICFGANTFPLEIKDKKFYFGDAQIVFDPKGTTKVIDDKSVKMPCLTVESDEWEDEENEIPTWEMEVSFFFDNEKVKPSAQLAAVNTLLKTGDFETFAKLVKPKGTGKGFPVKLVDVVRVFHESKQPIPNGGLQFKAISFEIGTPPESNPEYGYSLIVEIAEPVAYPVLYKERKDGKETGRILPYQSPVTRLNLSKATMPCKTLVDQATGKFFDTATTKKLFEWAQGEKGLYLMITELDQKEPDRRTPTCQLSPGAVTNNNVQMIADKFSKSSQNLLAAQASNGQVPFDHDEDVLEAAVVSGDEDF